MLTNTFIVAPEVKELVWFVEDELLFDRLFPLLLKAIQDGALTARNGLLEWGVGVDWELVNTAVTAYAREYTYTLVKGINETTQKFLQTEIPAWIQSGAPLDDLITALEPMFGAVRAELIAVTEVTNAYFQGNVATWKESGVVTTFRFNTAFDDDVCPICEPFDGQEYGLDDAEHSPAIHVRCRCWPTPVVNP